MRRSQARASKLRVSASRARHKRSPRGGARPRTCSGGALTLGAAPPQVLDVTKFLDDHPGGDEVLVGVAGQEASDEFEDVGHSTSAAKQIDEFVIGEIHPDEKVRSGGGGGAQRGREGPKNESL